MLVPTHHRTRAHHAHLPRGRAARAMHEFPPENLRNPARGRRAGAMRQFPSNQLDSIDLNLVLNTSILYTKVDLGDTNLDLI